MIANTGFPQIDSKGKQKRKFMSKTLAVGGLRLILGELIPHSAQAKSVQLADGHNGKLPVEMSGGHH